MIESVGEESFQIKLSGKATLGQWSWGQDDENHRKTLSLSSFKDKKAKVQEVKCVTQGLTIGKKSGFKAGSVWLLHSLVFLSTMLRGKGILTTLRIPRTFIESLLPPICLSLILLCFDSSLVPEEAQRHKREPPPTLTRLRKVPKFLGGGGGLFHSGPKC